MNGIVYHSTRRSVVQHDGNPDSLCSALPLRKAVVYCSLAPVTTQFVADGNIEMGGDGAIHVRCGR